MTNKEINEFFKLEKNKEWLQNTLLTRDKKAQRAFIKALKWYNTLFEKEVNAGRFDATCFNNGAYGLAYTCAMHTYEHYIGAR